MRLGAFRKLGRCGLLKRSSLKVGLTLLASQSLRVEIRRTSVRGWVACSVRQKRAFLRERGFASAHLAAWCGVEQAQHSRAMRPRWLAWAAFYFGIGSVHEIRGMQSVTVEIRFPAFIMWAVVVS